MRHLDLFSGIGGFAYAVDQVFGDVEHIFCDNDKFCQQVLKKHWKDSYIYDDIRAITADSHIGRYLHRRPKKQPAEKPHQTQRQPEPSVRASGIQPEIARDTEGKRYPSDGTVRQRQDAHPERTDTENEFGRVDLLTGGFPCQPFSAAGLRRGTADDRHLWPEMLRVIRLVKPEWVIAENVRGLLTWDGGLVFKQVCTDLEAAGYAVQPLIIPAVAVNAPHRRDRVWFVAHRKSERDGGRTSKGRLSGERQMDKKERQRGKVGSKNQGRISQPSDDTNSNRPELQVGKKENLSRVPGFSGNAGKQAWNANWLEVATRLCGVDDGLPTRMDGFELTKSKHRQERLKALGNAIVPEIAMEIMRGIQLSADYK